MPHPISHYTFYVCVKFSPNEHQCASSVGAPHLTDNPRIDLGGSKLSGLTFSLAHQVTFTFCTEVLTNGVCPCCAMLCSDISCILASPLLLCHQAINTIALLPISVVKGKGNVVQHFYLINKACYVAVYIDRFIKAIIHGHIFFHFDVIFSFQE